MNALFHEVEPIDTELHLGIGVILAIFFGITLVSAVFFGLGYSFGRTGNAPSGSAIVQSEVPAIVATPETTHSIRSPQSTTSSVNTISSPSAAVITAQSQSVRHAAAVSKSASTPSHTAPAAVAGASKSYMVQIAAVAGHKDAQVLATALQKHGLNAKLFSGTHDKFFHVQIGPFATQQKAEAMRHKVIAAGYRAILKPTS